jgi:predicted DNA-binding transcriptional regulator AlpA
MVEAAIEFGVNWPSLRMMMNRDPATPKPVEVGGVKMHPTRYYTDEIRQWWRQRQENKNG